MNLEAHHPESVDPFHQITETPGLMASQDQLDMLQTRYAWAADFASNKDVLEVACGTGIGLGLLAGVARSVVGGDLDEKNLRLAATTYKASSKISLQNLDAQKLPFEGGAFDLVIMFEAIYYLPNPLKFMAEAHRVLRPNGRLLISSVNPDWQTFHRSPYSHKYPRVSDLVQWSRDCGFSSANVSVGFPDRPEGFKQILISSVKRRANQLGLIPKTLGGRAWLKRIFSGRLAPLPEKLDSKVGHRRPLVSYQDSSDLRYERILYLEAVKGG